jgi:cell division cycle protein 20 (cofactor of APC complex)
MISGSKDRLINFSDLRLQDCLIKSLQYHSGEICSLKVKPDQKNVFASGANDNKVCIWDIRDNNPFSVIKGHQGAVKAISWCPWKTNTLATGGGKNDRTIKIWNNNGDLICKK